MRADYARLSDPLESKYVRLVARHQVVGGPADGKPEQKIVERITTHVHLHGRGDVGGQITQQVDQPPGLAGADAGSGARIAGDPPDLGKLLARYKELESIVQPSIKQQCRRPPGAEQGRNQDIRVEDDTHGSAPRTP